MKIAVLGAGAWGTAVAIHAAQHHEVTLWTRQPEHAQAITAQWRSEGLEGPDLHRFLGLGSLPPEILRALCVDRATRFARVAGEEDLAAVHGALGLQRPASATRP